MASCMNFLAPFFMWWWFWHTISPTPSPLPPHPVLKGSVAYSGASVSAYGGPAVPLSGTSVPFFTSWDVPASFTLTIQGPTGTGSISMIGKGNFPRGVRNKVRGWAVKVSQGIPVLPKVCTKEMCFYVEGDQPLYFPVVSLDLPHGFVATLTYVLPFTATIHGEGHHHINGCLIECATKHISVIRR